MTSIPPHTNIVRYFGIYESKTFFNIVMEVAEGGSLDDVLFPPFNENTNEEKGKRNLCNISSNPYRQQPIVKNIGEEHKSRGQTRNGYDDLDVDPRFSDFSNSVADCDRHIRERQKSSSTSARGDNKERRDVNDNPPYVNRAERRTNRDEAVFTMQDLRSAAIPASAPHIPEHLLVCWLHQCLVGLAHLHQHGVVHRDVKAANMLLACPSTGTGHDQRIMWTDFGVSAADGPSSSGGVGIGGGTSVYLGRTANGLSSTLSTLRTGGGRGHDTLEGEEEPTTITPRAPERTTAAVATAHRTVIGTMGFAAPEVLEHWGSGGTARYSAACDLWGIGVVLYCFITGRGWLPSGGCVGVATSPSEIIDVCCGRLPKLCALRMCGVQDGVESCDDSDGDDACLEWVTDEESGDDSSLHAGSGDDEASPSRPHRPASQQIGAKLSDSRAPLARFCQVEQAQRAAAFSSDLMSLIDSLMSVDYSHRPTARKALSSRVFAARLERPLSLFVMNDSLPVAMNTALVLLTAGTAKLTSSTFGNSNGRDAARNRSWASGLPHERFASRQVRVFPIDLESIDTIFFKQMAKYQRRNHQCQQEKRMGITIARSQKDSKDSTREEASERQKSCRKLESVNGIRQNDTCTDDFEEGCKTADLHADMIYKRALAAALDAHAQALVGDPRALCLTSVSRSHSIFEDSLVVEIAVGIAGDGFRELAESLKNQYINEMMREHVGTCRKHLQKRVLSGHAHLVAVSDVVLEATTLAQLRLVMPSTIRKGWEAFCQEFFWRDREEISLRQRRTLPSGMSTVYLIYTIPTRVHDSNTCLGRDEVDANVKSKERSIQSDNKYSSSVESFLRTLRYETIGNAFPRWLAFVRTAGSVISTGGAGAGGGGNADNGHEVETEEDSSTNDWFANEAALVSFFQRNTISAIVESTSPTIAPPDPLFRSRAPSMLSPHGALRHDNIFIPAPPERYSASFAASFVVDVGCSSLRSLLASVAGALIVGPRDPFGASVAAVERYCASADAALCPITSTTTIDRDDDSLPSPYSPRNSGRTKLTACGTSCSLDFVHLCQLCFELGFVFENAASRDTIETEVVKIVSSAMGAVPVA